MASSQTVRPPATHFDSSDSSSSASSPYAQSDSDFSAPSVRHSMDSVTCQRPVAGVAILRCMRCAREVEATTTDDPSDTGMVPVGTNIYYCSRCARIVGYK